MTDGEVESARQRLDAGMPPQAVARNLGVSVPTLYRGLPAGGREEGTP
jgi:DNA invertase Pin-like site-specific DNA recombinase